MGRSRSSSGHPYPHTSCLAVKQREEGREGGRKGGRTGGGEGGREEGRREGGREEGKEREGGEGREIKGRMK